ncbi:hypothetical protein [Actinacidiphila oryziradicis]|uniref:Uncharacterized protein n=1 Tax=Actinacidiphila oryziradicis TaxID=2571141 RepID=A0A4U0SJ51_9ACTN|nr:hypothetical protein [Actinacidiphila oryziradicis]TKA08071.1 hypothetical protein FCI23_29680 [Actinacidiphila oryziradicis]
MNADMTERLVRFQQPEKTLTYLGGLAEFLRAQREPTLDTRAVTSGLHLDDGLHLTLAGQRAIAVALVHALAELS